MGAANQRGVTLVELVIGISVFAIALLLLMTLFYNQSSRSVDALMRFRAAELAQSVMNEMASMRFDEHTDPNGAMPCGIEGAKSCTSAANWGPEESIKAHWDDVDDFHGLTENGKIPTIINHGNKNATYADLYPHYQLNVTVSYHDDTASRKSKLIKVIVTTPNKEALEFAALRVNF